MSLKGYSQCSAASTQIRAVVEGHLACSDVLQREGQSSHTDERQWFTVTPYLLWLTDWVRAAAQACIDQSKWLGPESFLTALRGGEQAEALEAQP